MQVKQYFNCIVITLMTGTRFPQVYIHFVNPNFLRLKYNWISQGLQFEGPIKWPGNISIDDNNGVVIFEFEKTFPCEWKTTYTPVQDFQYVKPLLWKVVIEDNYHLSPDTCILTAKYIENVYFIFRAGNWINVEHTMEGETKRRYYFLVPKQPLVSLTDPNPYDGIKYPTINNISFMVKSTGRGGLNDYLFDRVPGDILEITEQDGKFNLEAAANRSRVYLIAGGTGIAPATTIALRLLQLTKKTKVHVLHFNYDQRRIIFSEYFEKLKELDKRFKITYLSQYAQEDWEGNRGFVTKEFLKSKCGVPCFAEDDESVYFVISGAFHFIIKTKRILTNSLNYPQRCLFTYLGM
ncbi:uncharacterized protein LOC142318081 [Lycorma delicatula]|uniref:uncharacterized protein LOC142318081 n=1 Tax=Lycorma delicatula TaxID=130591 RepID=UPI003F50F199